MDIVRKKNSNGNFFYLYKKTKKRVQNKNIIKHINTLKIPPAYQKVKISKDKNSKIQAIGVDSKNRSQYIYNKEFLEQQSNEKFEDLIHFVRKIRNIRSDILKNIKLCYYDKTQLQTKNCLISIVLFLIDKCNFRVGNEKYKKLYNTYGVTTLNNSHFEINKNNVRIKFVGKKGVINESKIENKEATEIFNNICRQNNGLEYIFSYRDHKGNIFRITEKHINDFLKKYNKNLSVKMFRTYKANYILIKDILDYPLPETQREASRNIRQIIKKASSKMHHTGNVSKKSYMNNKIIDLYLYEPEKFNQVINDCRRTNGELPVINKILIKLLQFN